MAMRCSAILQRLFFSAGFVRRHTSSYLSRSLEPRVWLWQCALGSQSCWNIPALPSFWRLRIIPSAGILVQPRAFVVPVYKSHPRKPRIVTLPPPRFTVRTIHSPWKIWPGSRPTRRTPSEPNKFISVSSDRRTCS